MGIIRLLSAKSTPVPFLDHAETLARLETWTRSERRFAIHALGGDGGSGKTYLGVGLCRRLTTLSTHRQGAEVRQVGFLQNIERSDNTPSSNDALLLLLVINRTEARPEVITEIINVALRAAEDPERRRAWIVLLVRRLSPLLVTHQSSNKWPNAFRPQKSQDEGVNFILDGTSVIILSDEGLSDREREELFEAAYKSFTGPPESSPASSIIEQLNGPIYFQPLLVTVDTFLNTRPQSRTWQSCLPSELFEEVPCHEEHYWTEHWPSNLTISADRYHRAEGTANPTDTQDNLNRKLARQAVTVATLADIQDEENTINPLNLLPANPGKNTKGLARWLRNCYPPHVSTNGQPALWCDHLEPGRIGERLVASAVDDLVPLLRELLSPSRVGTSSLRTWIVLEHTSADRHPNGRVGWILNEVLTEVIQAVHAQAIDSQSPSLTTSFAKLFSAVCSHVDPDSARETELILSEGGYSTAFLGCELTQLATNVGRPADDTPEADRAAYALRRLSLSRYLANVGRHDKALKAVRKATNLYRGLAEHNPAAYAPSLTMSLNNLTKSQAENGQRRETLQTAQEAVTIHRNLAEHNPAAHAPNPTTSLSNLASYLDSNGQRREALQTAQEAVTIRWSLVEHNSAAHTSDLVIPLNTPAIYLNNNG